MASPNGHYDQNLLAAAPAATKAQLQEGYNPDLLEQSRTGPSPSAPGTDPGHTHVSKEYATRPLLPFWRTRKGIIIIFVAAVVVVGAVVGGAVGGTVGKKKVLSSNSTVSGSPLASEFSGLFSSTTPTSTGHSHGGDATAAITGQPVASGQPSQSLIPGLTLPSGGAAEPITSGGGMS